MIRDILVQIEDIDKRLKHHNSEEKLKLLRQERAALIESCAELEPEDKVFLARHPMRPHIEDFIGHLFTDFFEQKGDHLFDEDKSIYGGIARFHGIPVTVVGHHKGHSVEESMEYNFGMPRPEGYRKALRLMDQAEKFGRPIITFIDTPGAYPGLEAEEHGQGEAIARNLAKMSSYHVPVIAVVTGEGNSGGALALGVANRIIMLENAVYSVLSPEGFASILWKDSARAGEASAMMKLTADDLYKEGIADDVVREPLGGAQLAPEALYQNLDLVLYGELTKLLELDGEALRLDRHDKIRKIG